MKRKQSLKDQAIDIANKREYARKYYQAHKQEARAYYILHRGRIRYIAERWRRDNRERYLEQQREYDRTKRIRAHAQDRVDQYEKERKNMLVRRFWQQGIADRIKALKRP